jgi:hypothetical protein
MKGHAAPATTPATLPTRSRSTGVGWIAGRSLTPVPGGTVRHRSDRNGYDRTCPAVPRFTRVQAAGAMRVP